MENKVQSYSEVLPKVHNQIKQIKTSIVEVNMAENYAIVKAKIITWRGESFEGIGDASLENLTAEFKDAFLRVAETRAKARALRDLANIGEPLAEEYSGQVPVVKETKKKKVVDKALQEAVSFVDKAVERKNEQENVGGTIVKIDPPVEVVEEEVETEEVDTQDGIKEEEVVEPVKVEGKYDHDTLKQMELGELETMAVEDFGINFLELFTRKTKNTYADLITAIQNDSLEDYLKKRLKDKSTEALDMFYNKTEEVVHDTPDENDNFKEGTEPFPVVEEVSKEEPEEEEPTLEEIANELAYMENPLERTNEIKNACKVHGFDEKDLIRECNKLVLAKIEEKKDPKQVDLEESIEEVEVEQSDVTETETNEEMEERVANENLTLLDETELKFVVAEAGENERGFSDVRPIWNEFEKVGLLANGEKLFKERQALLGTNHENAERFCFAASKEEVLKMLNV